jgi:hypothetical protein
MTQTKTTFGSLEAIKAPTPKWATYTYRATIALTTAIAFYVAGSSLVADLWKTEIILGLKSLDMVVFALSKMFGVKTEEKE